MPSKRKIASTDTTAITPSKHNSSSNTTTTAAAAAASSTTVSVSVPDPVPDPDHPLPASDSAAASTSLAAPASKRQRVSRACDQCRAAREKCDGIQPLCFPCVSQNRPCTYAANPKKRGVQTGYIKTLEVTLAWLFDKVPGCEEALEALLLHEGGQGQSLLVGKDPDRANRMHKRWRKSKVHKEIDRILSGGDTAQSRVDKESPLDDDESEVDQSEKAPGPRQSVDTSQEISRSEMPAAEYAQSNAACAPNTVIQLPANHWRLVDIYFSYTHAWYPILEKQDLLKTIYTYGDAGLHVHQLGPQSAAHAELWAAMALASYQDGASAHLFTAPAASPLLSPDDMYDTARKLIPAEEGDFEIQHARASLLLALISIGKGKKTSAWILVGLAHRIALDVPETHHNDERSSRRVTAVLMGCYILDTLISVHRRGMPSLDTAGIIEGMSVPEDNLDEWQPWAPCDGFGLVLRPSSRSPAYSLTTFNQVYDVFKFMRKRTLQRQNGLLPSEHAGEAMMLLHQTIKPRLPFASFIVARDSSSVTIPSAYVLRILFLWVGAILESANDSACTLILESVEQYLAQFGACGAPPFFSSCLLLMRQHHSFLHLHPHSRQRWETLQDALLFIWMSPNPMSPHAVRPPSALGTTTATGASEVNIPSASNHAAASMTVTTPSEIYPAPHTLQTPTLLPPQYPPPQSEGPFSMNNFSYGAPVGGPDLGRPPARGHHRDSFGGGSLDYDALLDDLSSMDYVDRVDADPQFMANLGFAPGCDISEILKREFGAI